MVGASTRRQSNRQRRRSDADTDPETDGTAVSADTDEEEEDDEEGDAEWEGDDEIDDEEEAPVKNTCFYCHQDEEHDPGEEYEDPLECALCGQYAHRYCAREARQDAGGTEGIPPAQDEAEFYNWRCAACADIPVVTETEAQQAQEQDELGDEDAEGEEYDEDAIGEDDFEDVIVVNGDAPEKEPETPRAGRLLRRRRDTAASDDEAVEEDMEKLQLGDGEDEASEFPAPKRRKGLKFRMVGASTGRRRKELVDTASAYVTVHKRGARLIVRFHSLDYSKLKISEEDLAKRRYNQRRPTSKARKSEKRGFSERRGAFPPQSATPGFGVTPHLSQQLRGSITDEAYANPYGGVLDGEDADTSKTYPEDDDRDKFERSKEVPVKQTFIQTENKVERGDPAVNDDSVEPEAAGTSQIKCIHFGNYEIDTWYTAPYPEEYSRNRILYICEFCLKYMNSEFVSIRHKYKCPAKHPPGDEIYRDGSISVFEVDGRKHPIYCQNLCLLAKLFLGSKTLYYDVEPFLFYIMTETDAYGCHFVGYFSKEKRSTTQNNVSCILTLPIHQRKGYGNLLIAFSYLLTRTEGKTGSPEKPLSDLGLLSYRNYWKLVLSYELRNQTTPLSLKELSIRTGMSIDDVVSAAEHLGALVQDPITGSYAMRLDRKLYEDVIQKWEKKAHLRLNPDALVWTPFLTAHSAQPPAVSTIAPRVNPRHDDETESLSAPAPSGKDLKDLNALQSKLLDSAKLFLNESDTDHATKMNGGHSASEPTSMKEEKNDEDDEDDNNSDASQRSHDYERYLRTSREIPPNRYQIVPAPPGNKTPFRKNVQQPPTTGRRPPARTPGTTRGRRSQHNGEFTSLPPTRRPRSKVGESPSSFPSSLGGEGGASITGSVVDVGERFSGDLFGSDMVTKANPALEDHARQLAENARAFDDGDELMIDPAIASLDQLDSNIDPSLQMISNEIAIDPALAQLSAETMQANSERTYFVDPSMSLGPSV